MSSRTIKKSVLFRTSAASGSDIQYSGGKVTIAGLDGVYLSDITAISQIKYRAEVAQVITVGGTSFTPTGGTVYAVEVYDPLRIVSGYTESPKTYKMTTVADITTYGNAAAQREAISVALVTAINLDASNHVVAATLGSGLGFTVTDDGSYYPVYAQNMSNVKGVSFVKPITNSDGTGYAATNVSVTTAGVYSFGVGANLAAEKPVVDFVMGTIVSGIIDNPPVTSAGLPAVSGQNYDGYVIQSYKIVDAITLGGQFAYQVSIQRVFVDNGTGSSTTNLTNYLAFQKAAHKLMTLVYANDESTTREFFDSPIVFQDPLGAAASGTADNLGLQLSVYSSLNRTNIGTQTKVVPVPTTGGYDIDQDDTATEGSHTSANQQAGSTLGSYIVGKTEFSVSAAYKLTDYTDAAFMVGFRKKAAYGAVINNYSDYATIGNGSSAAGTTWINGDLFVTRANLNGGTTKETISAVIPADSTEYLLTVKVDINGTVTALVGNTSYPIYSVGTTAMVFDAGDELIPFYQIVNIGSGDPASTISEFFSVANKDLIS
jgi:hypothetical protein